MNKILTARQRSDLIASLRAGADALDARVEESEKADNQLMSETGESVARARAARLRRFARELEKDQEQATRARGARK